MQADRIESRSKSRPMALPLIEWVRINGLRLGGHTIYAAPAWDDVMDKVSAYGHLCDDENLGSDKEDRE